MQNSNIDVNQVLFKGAIFESDRYNKPSSKKFVLPDIKSPDRSNKPSLGHQKIEYEAPSTQNKQSKLKILITEQNKDINDEIQEPINKFKPYISTKKMNEYKTK